MPRLEPAPTKIAPAPRLKEPEKLLTPVKSQEAEFEPQELLPTPLVTVSAPPLSASTALMVFISMLWP